MLLPVVLSSSSVTLKRCWQSEQPVDVWDLAAMLLGNRCPQRYGTSMGKYVAPPGAIVKGWTVALEPSPQQAARFRRDDGARRFAHNWAVAQIKRAFDQGAEAGEHDPAVWSAWSLRKRWNAVKAEAAPWWAECSKEAFSNGIADAVTALRNWHGSKTGTRAGPRVGFPQFRKKGKDQVRCTYTTGALRVEGPRHIVLPCAGRVQTTENIRPIWRHIRRGTGRLLAATVRERAGRWSVSLRLEISAPWQPGARADTVGVDVGIGDCLLTVMRSDGTVAVKVPNSRALRGALAELRGANRALSRKTQGSIRWRKAKFKLGRSYARVAAIRSDALHKATTNLAKTHGQIVIEDLGIASLIHGLRSHRKSWIDAAAGEMRRQLAYKCEWYGAQLWIANQFYPSSKTCSECGLVKASLTLSDRAWECTGCGITHDRDENAGTNLARLPASQAEAQSDSKTAVARHVAVKRVNHLGKVAV
jgi:putative transposase